MPHGDFKTKPFQGPQSIGTVNMDSDKNCDILIQY